MLLHNLSRLQLNRLEIDAKSFRNFVIWYAEYQRATVPFRKLQAPWGYGARVELSLTKSQWEKIIRGDKMFIEGEGYWYEGEFFQDNWYFSGGLDGDWKSATGSPPTAIFRLKVGLERCVTR